MKTLVRSLALVPALPALALAQGWNSCLWGLPGSGSRIFWGGGMIMGIVTIALIALLVFFGVRLMKNGQGAGPADPLTILKARYARGEINRDEFESMKKDLL
jgi:putative membrane protein